MADHLWDLFRRPLLSTPDKTALEIGGRALSYAALARAALRVSGTLRAEQGFSGGPVGLWASREASAYAGVLGILHAGGAYVPLHPGHPPARTHAILQRTGVRAIVCGQAELEMVRALVQELDPRIAILTVSFAEGPAARSDAPAHPAELAYVLFTSGSTGEPKGVPIGHRNVLAYLTHAATVIAPVPEDRFTQTFDLTFDLSVHDLFLCWGSGATLVVPDKEALLRPSTFIRDQRITQWFSVPSLAVLMDRQRALKEDAFPTLRCSAFCGEPLSMDVAGRWALAACNSRVLNLYGPTEATIAITAYERPRAQAAGTHGILSIGRPFPGTPTRIVDEQGADAAEGELWLAGPQLTQGYWSAGDSGSKAFVDGPDGIRYYRTGDRVKRDPEGLLHFLARIDDQVKVRGHRIELEEVNQALRRTTGAAFAVTLAHPVRDGVATGLVSFLPSEVTATTAEVLAQCRTVLPDHMVPGRIVALDVLPTTTSGKADLNALRDLLDGPAQALMPKG